MYKMWLFISGVLLASFVFVALVLLIVVRVSEWIGKRDEERAK